MRILWLQWRDIKSPWAGGAEVYMHEILKRLCIKGHEALALTSGFKDLPMEEVLEGYRIKRLGSHDSYLLHLHKTLSQYTAWADVVVEDTSKIPLYTPLRSNGKPVVAIVHHLNREIYFEELPLRKALMAYIMEGFMPRLYSSLSNTKLVAVSKSTYEELVKLGAKPDKITIIADAVDSSKYKPKATHLSKWKAERPILLYLSRLKRYKQPQHVVLAFKYIADKIPYAKLIIAGDGDFKPKLERLIKRLRLESKVEVKGKVTEAEKVQLLQEAWVLIQTSRKEGFDMVVLEANACGTPAVGYDVPGLRDSIRHGETGMLVKPGDLEALAEVLTSLLEDDVLREKMSRNALKWSKKFTWNKTAEEFLKVVGGAVRWT
jgi:glycosyltransferase involved in cell wall biosynthesis